jgi:hypothetical protein
LRGALRRGMDNVLDGSHTGNGIFGEDTELQRKGTGELAIKVDGAAAHSRDDAGAFDLGAFELNKDDGLARPEEIGHHADHFEVELLYLVARENRVGIALHAGANLVEWKSLIRLRERDYRKENANQGEAKDSEKDACGKMEQRR